MAATVSCLRCHAVCGGVVYAQQRQLPLQALSCVKCHRGNPLTQRRDLAHYRLIAADYAWYRFTDSKIVKAGEKQVETLACRRCHALAGKGNDLATNLDLLYDQALPDDMDKSIRVPAFFMPDFALPKDDVTSLVTVIFTAGVSASKISIEPPQVIHFENGSTDQNLFAKHCGQCHRVLTAQQGGIGVGVISPNLSGLLGEFYPKTFKGDQPWTFDGLKKWIKNPRSVDPLTRMMPVVINDQDMTTLVEETWPLKVKE